MASKRKTHVLAAPVGEKVDVSVPLTELQRYKLEALEGRVTALVGPVREALAKKYQQMLNEELQTVITTHPAIVSAQKERDAYVDEVLSAVEPQLPEGYAVFMLSHEKGEAHARFSPEQRGKRLTAG